MSEIWTTGAMGTGSMEEVRGRRTGSTTGPPTAAAKAATTLEGVLHAAATWGSHDRSCARNCHALDHRVAFIETLQDFSEEAVRDSETDRNLFDFLFDGVRVDQPVEVALDDRVVEAAITA